MKTKQLQERNYTEMLHLFNITNIGGEVVKQNDTYKVKDNKTLKNLVLSSTLLNPGKCTTGHKHEGQEEVYIFVAGTAKMELVYPNGDTKIFEVHPDDIVLIEDGVFHKVYNESKNPVYFVCVFDGKRNH